MKIDSAALKKELERQKATFLQEKTNELENLIEEQYCSIHGKFAEFQSADKLGSSNVQLSFSYCCENLKDKVEEAFKIWAGQR